MKLGKLVKWSFAGAVLLAACVAVGVAMAQDTPDKGTSGIKFAGKGTLDVTGTTVTGSVTVTKPSIEGLGTGEVSGDFARGTCTVTHKKECCPFTSTETYSFSGGDLYVTLAGTACGKKQTKVTAKKVSFDINGGTGDFSGAEGSGTASFNFNLDTGAGTFKFSGTASAL